jgi:hypothetical protein
VIPNWTFFWAIACAEYIERTADLQFAQQILPEMVSTLETYLGKLNEQGLLEITAWNLLDWAPIEQPNRGVVTHQNMFLVKALELSALVATWTHNDEQADSLKLQADMLRTNIRNHLWCEEKKAFYDCIHHDGRYSERFSMQTQVVAYLCRIEEGERKDILRGYLLQPPENFVQIGSPFMSFFYHEALAMEGYVQRIVDDTRLNWGMMLDHDATTCWEMFPGSNINRANKHFLTRSHTHAWSAAPGYFLGAYVLGIQPQGLGWKKIKIEPNPCDLSWARGNIPLPEGGRIEVRWTRSTDERYQLHITAPKSIEIEARFPEGISGDIEIARL